MRLTNLDYPTVGGETDAETLAWFRWLDRQACAIVCKKRDAIWAAFDTSMISEDGLFWLWRVSLGQQKQTARALMDASRAKTEAWAARQAATMAELDTFLSSEAV